MEFFRDTNIDFMKYRKGFMLLSVALNVVAILAVFVHGKLNVGVDFAGGTQLTVKFAERPPIDDLRSLLAAAGVPEAQIQRFGEDDENEVIIRASLLEGSEEGSRALIEGALERRFNPDAEAAFDLNRRGREALATLLLTLDPSDLRPIDEEAAAERYREIAAAIVERRDEEGLFTDWSQVAAVPGVDNEVLVALREAATLGRFAVLGAENVGPQIGAELRRKAFLAVGFAMLGMLVYITLRFELRYGIGAVLATLHDVLVTLGLFALFDLEFNLTTIAGFLTLVGYSVNDTVVVFDRVRENLRRTRRDPLVEVINRSLNQTLSRTVLTSGTTLLVVTSLLVLGGDVLRGFAFIMTVGVIVGTYSSLYVAGPFALLWERYLGKESRSRGKTGVAQSKA